jgi:Flp pilus assembly protein TadD
MSYSDGRFLHSVKLGGLLLASLGPALVRADSNSGTKIEGTVQSNLRVPDRHTIDELIRRKRWGEAIRLLDLRLSAESGSASDLIARGNARAELGRFTEARADFTRAAALVPTNPEPQYRLALACLAASEMNSYRQASGALINRFSAAEDASVASPVAYTCVARPDAGIDPAVLVQVAERAVPLFRGNERVLGAACYRAGRSREAVQHLEHSARSTTPVAWDWVFLAMAHQRLGHEHEARAYLDRAANWIALAECGGGQPAKGARRVWHSWNERAEVRSLWREAEVLLGVKGEELPAHLFGR